MAEILQDFSKKSAEFADSDNFIVKSQPSKVAPVTSENSSSLNFGKTQQNFVRLPGWCANDTLRCGGCDLFLGLIAKPKNQRTHCSGRGGAR